jgi:hypothetical protein
MKHPHAEVLIAIAEGREVEFRTIGSEWAELTLVTTINPIAYDHLEWRVKKEPVVEVKYFYLESQTANGLRYVKVEPNSSKWDTKITFEDDIAVKAEFPFKVKIDGLG